jgi:hypothetical protein
MSFSRVPIMVGMPSGLVNGRQPDARSPIFAHDGTNVDLTG